MAIGEVYRPYIHSNIYNFHRQISGSLDENSEEGKAYFAESIRSLETMKDMLKTEAEAFLGGQKPQEVMNNLNDSDKVFSKITRRILEEKASADIILNGKDYKKAIVAAKKTFKGLGPEVEKAIEKGLGIDEIADIVAPIIFNNMEGKSGKEQQVVFLSFLRNSKKIEKEISLKITKTLTSNKGKIKELIKKAIRANISNNHPSYSTNDTREYFLNHFEKRFYNILATENFIYEKGTEIKYLNAFKNKVKQELDQNIFNYKNIRNIYGVFTEDFLKINFESLSSNELNIVVVGKESEEDLSKKYNTLVRRMMATHHDTSRMSGTDLLLTNPRTKRTVRVQSKNLSSAYQDFIKNEEAIRSISAEKARNYKDLISVLESSGTLTLTDEDLENISYLLANEIWFRARGSYGERDGRKISEQTSGLQYTHKIVEKIFSKQIANFIGVSIDDVFNIEDTRASGSNIFYLISGNALLPTYKIIEQIIKFLKQEEAKLVRFKISLKTSGYSLEEAKSFYKKKLNAVGTFNAKDNYTSASLLKVGMEQGEKIIDQLTFSSIRLQINFKELFTSSYFFEF